jgi:uncharacterized protein (TIGR03000 family)
VTGTTPGTPGTPGYSAAPATNEAPARIVVSLPADANLTIDGTTTVSTSARRVFESPRLASGRTYSYTFQAQYTRDGRPVTVSRNVRITAGAEVNVSMFENTSVAAR